LRADLEEYHGEINEVKHGIRKDIPEKPDELAVYELIKSTGLHLVPGGLMQQPHIWLMMWEIIDGTEKVFEHLDKIEQEREKVH